MFFQSKIIVVVKNDLQQWQKLNVVAFLMSGVMIDHPELKGEPYVDSVGNEFSQMAKQPVFVYGGSATELDKVSNRALRRGVKTSAYIEQMFSTGHDEENRQVFSEHGPDEGNLVGIGFYCDSKEADKLVKGIKRHS
ncbi:DUF2000 family protein [Salinisphaera hydrothermalis]|uniref:DUF2000 family protein n=1 Tax=Salinisphaera hydrothermalis TaxID=563188 RepID=UPI0033418F3F